jgi:hypothetical protein
MNTLNIKPAKENLIVRMPEKNNQPLPATGCEVPDNNYWRRRLHDGDVVQIEAPAVVKAGKPNTQVEK